MMSDAVKLEKTRFTWQINWKVCAFSLAFFPLLVGLGFWQLDRAEQKRTLQQQLAEQQALEPLTITSSAQLGAIDHTATFRQVALTGQYDTQHTWLLENQVINGRLGYSVVQPLVLSDGQGILVNRGWIPSMGTRAKLPPVKTPSMPVRVSGRLVQPSRNRLLNDQVIEGSWPRTILQVEPATLALQSQLILAPWILQIDPADPTGFVTQWKSVVMPADQHLGYAVQWFFMALALAILTLYANSNVHEYMKAQIKR